MNSENNMTKAIPLDKMKGAILEVLLVSAEGIRHSRHTSIVGHPAYHVILECGTQMCRSKTSSANLDKIYWNEKITFQFPSAEVETLSHLKLKIVNEEFFTDDEFVGETIIFLKGMIVEGNLKGLVELHPVPFNVVLEDDTYKGQMTIGLKIIPNIVLQIKQNECAREETNLGESICTVITTLWQRKWWKLFSSCRNRHLINKTKEN